MAVTFPSIPVSQQSSRSAAQSMSVAQFGNGYEQRIPLGRNFRRRKTNVVWEGLTTTDRNTILTFLDAMSGGDVTSWQSEFDTVARLWVLEGEDSCQNTGGATWTIACTLRQVFQE